MVEVVRKVKVAIANGIHARPSHSIVSMAVDFDAEISIFFEGRRADAKSILSVMTLGAPLGAPLEIRASGPAAKEAVDALVAFIESSSDE